MAYSKKELARVLGVPDRKIQYYIDLGLVIPEIQPPSGRGRAMLFSELNRLEFLFISELTERGLSLAGVALIMQHTRDIKFFMNDAWGNTVELLFVARMPEGSEPMFFVEHSLAREKMQSELFDFLQQGDAFQVVRLGAIRAAAYMKMRAKKI